MAIAKKIKRTPAKRGRPPKAKTRARAVAKPKKVLTRLEAAEIALNEAQKELDRLDSLYKKASKAYDKAAERVEKHRGLKKARAELMRLVGEAA